MIPSYLIPSQDPSPWFLMPTNNGLLDTFSWLSDRANFVCPQTYSESLPLIPIFPSPDVTPPFS